MTNRNEKYIVMVQRHGGIKRDNSRVLYRGTILKSDTSIANQSTREITDREILFISKDRTVSLFSIKKKKISIVGSIRFISKSCRSIYRVYLRERFGRISVDETRSKHAFNL